MACGRPGWLGDALDGWGHARLAQRHFVWQRDMPGCLKDILVVLRTRQAGPRVLGLRPAATRMY